MRVLCGLGIFFLSFMLNAGVWSSIHTFRGGPVRIYHSWPEVLIGLFFVLIGSALVLSPLWVWLQIRYTTYAITNRRATHSASSDGWPWHQLLQRRDRPQGRTSPGGGPAADDELPRPAIAAHPRGEMPGRVSRHRPRPRPRTPRLMVARHRARRPHDSRRR